MGISASQGKLLFMTARISNNEFQQQSIAFSKQRLADRASGVNERYNEALNATKYQLLVGYNGVNPNYEDLTYNMLTSYNSASSGRQYIVKDQGGKVLVSNELAKAFKDNNGDFNKFLESLGYTQADVNVNKTDETEEAIHNAWDKYLVSVDESIENMGDLNTHILGFSFIDNYPTYKTAMATSTIKGNTTTESLYRDNQGYYTNRETFVALQKDGDDEWYVGFKNSDGNTSIISDNSIIYDNDKNRFIYNNQEYNVLYINPKNFTVSETQKDYLMLLSGTKFKSDDGILYDVDAKSHALNYSGTTTTQRELYDYACAITKAYSEGGTGNLKYDGAMVNYYRNIFNEMMSCGFTTLSGKVENNESNVNETDFKDSQWFVNQLKSGKLRIAYYSTTSKAFVGTTIDDDSAIVEKEDKTKIAQAEQEYNTQMDKIEHDEKMFDMELNKLEAEHQALTTELESINKVIQNNIKGSFGTFKTSV